MASPPPAPLSIERYGLSEVYRCDNPIADIVFVHGLNGDPERTWTAGNGVFWPRDLLSHEFGDRATIKERARVLVYGYDADVVSGFGSSGGTSKDMIHNHAERLVSTLVANRRRQRAEERPIVFVGHSLGGLVIKRALIYSSEVPVASRTERLRSVFLSTYAILFLGTPHHGADLAVWGSYLEKLANAIVPRKILDTSTQLVDALRSNSETLQNIDRQFASLLLRFHVYFFHEAKKTDIKGTLKFIVDEDSAAPALPDVERAGIQADHSHMCKFESEHAPGYDVVSDAVGFSVDDAEETHGIAQNWHTERQVRRINYHPQHPYLPEPAQQPEISDPSSRGSSPAPTPGRPQNLLTHEAQNVEYEIEELETVQR